MKYLVYFVVCLLATIGLFGQAFTMKDQPFLGVAGVIPASSLPYSPTNISGVTNLSRWVADNISTGGTNNLGAVSNWVDSGVSPKNLTNLAVETTWPFYSNNVLNGHAIVKFFRNANNYLKTVNYTSAQPHTVFMVVRYSSPTNGTTSYFFDSTDATKRNALFQSTAGKLTAFAGSSGGVVNFTTNVWHTIEVLYNGAASGMWIDNVSVGTISVNTQVENGITMGSSNDTTGGGPVDIAEVVTWFGSLGAVDSNGTFSVAAARSNHYVFQTNTYALAP